MTAISDEAKAALEEIRAEMIKYAERRKSPGVEPSEPGSVTASFGGNPQTLYMVQQDGQEVALSDFESGFVYGRAVECRLRGEH